VSSILNTRQLYEVLSLIFAAAAYSILDIAIAIVGLIILWIIISIPVWLAGKAATGGKATIGDAMLATIAGPIVYYIVAILVGFFLGSVMGSTAWIFAYILAAHSLDLGFQSQFQHRLASSCSHCTSSMGNIRRPEQSVWGSLRNSLSGAILPKDIDRERANARLNLDASASFLNPGEHCRNNHALWLRGNSHIDLTTRLPIFY